LDEDELTAEYIKSLDEKVEHIQSLILSESFNPNNS